MTLRQFNNVLTVLVVTLGLYSITAPFLPQLLFWLRPTDPAVTAPYAGALATAVGNDTPAPLPEENRIVIPALSLDEPIIESNTINSISAGGTWRRPASSTPEKGGNTVIVGHRFFGSRASTFYHLDKLNTGEIIALYWNGVERLYRVDAIQTVAADALFIEAPSEQEKLTLYTCTPLWTATNRLVVTALPIEVSNE
jgi:LPXTG-site transpeptidase (sortase) family protein